MAGIAEAELREEELDALMRAARAFSGVVAASFAQVDDRVTWPQLRVLVIVATQDGVNAGSVAEALDIHPSGATRLCDRLVSAGLLERRTRPDDRRQVTLHLTSAGADLFSDVMDHRRTTLAEVLRRLGPGERTKLVRSLDRLSEALGEPAEGAWPRPRIRRAPPR